MNPRVERPFLAIFGRKMFNAVASPSLGELGWFVGNQLTMGRLIQQTEGDSR